MVSNFFFWNICDVMSQYICHPVPLLQILTVLCAMGHYISGLGSSLHCVLSSLSMFLYLDFSRMSVHNVLFNLGFQPQTKVLEFYCLLCVISTVVLLYGRLTHAVSYWFSARMMAKFLECTFLWQNITVYLPSISFLYHHHHHHHHHHHQCHHKSQHHSSLTCYRILCSLLLPFIMLLMFITLKMWKCCSSDVPLMFIWHSSDVPLMFAPLFSELHGAWEPYIIRLTTWIDYNSISCLLFL